MQSMEFTLHSFMAAFSQGQATPGTPCIRVNTHKRWVQARKRWAQVEFGPSLRTF